MLKGKMTTQISQKMIHLQYNQSLAIEEQDHHIKLYDNLEGIGKGGNATVYKGTIKQNDSLLNQNLLEINENKNKNEHLQNTNFNQQIAIKKSHAMKIDALHNFMDEFCVLKSCSHPNILRFNRAWLEKKNEKKIKNSEEQKHLFFRSQSVEEFEDFFQHEDDELCNLNLKKRKIQKTLHYIEEHKELETQEIQFDQNDLNNKNFCQEQIEFSGNIYNNNQQQQYLQDNVDQYQQKQLISNLLQCQQHKQDQQNSQIKYNIEENYQNEDEKENEQFQFQNDDDDIFFEEEKIEKNQQNVEFSQDLSELDDLLEFESEDLKLGKKNKSCIEDINKFSKKCQKQQQQVQVYGFIETELCEGNLAQYIRNRNKEYFEEMNLINGKNLEEKENLKQIQNLKNQFYQQAVNIAVQIFNGVQYLHNEKKLAHLDLKPQNIFLNNMGDVDKIEAKIGDLGSCKDNEKFLQFLDEVQFTPTYAPPEYLDFQNTKLNKNKKLHKKQKKNSKEIKDLQVKNQNSQKMEIKKKQELNAFKFDIFSLGVILTELFIPMQTSMEMLYLVKFLGQDKKSISQEKLEKLTNNILNQQIVEIIIQLLSNDVILRPQISDISHIFFQMQQEEQEKLQQQQVQGEQLINKQQELHKIQQLQNGQQKELQKERENDEINFQQDDFSLSSIKLIQQNIFSNKQESIQNTRQIDQVDNNNKFIWQQINMKSNKNSQQNDKNDTIDQNPSLPKITKQQYSLQNQQNLQQKIQNKNRNYQESWSEIEGDYFQESTLCSSDECSYNQQQLLEFKNPPQIRFLSDNKRKCKSNKFSEDTSQIFINKVNLCENYQNNSSSISAQKQFQQFQQKNGKYVTFQLYQQKEQKEQNQENQGNKLFIQLEQQNQQQQQQNGEKLNKQQQQQLDSQLQQEMYEISCSKFDYFVSNNLSSQFEAIEIEDDLEEGDECTESFGQIQMFQFEKNIQKTFSSSMGKQDCEYKIMN